MSTLVTFLDTVAREAYDPFFGCFVDRQRWQRINKKSLLVEKKCLNFNTEASETEDNQTCSDNKGTNQLLVCWICKDSHQLRNCPQFLKYSPEKRLEVIKDKKNLF